MTKQKSTSTRFGSAGSSFHRIDVVPEVAIKKTVVTFHQFFAVWAGMQIPAWQIPDLHIELLNFLSTYKDWENNTGLVEVFRGAAKSTMVGLFVTWLLTQDPTLRFLILSADKKTATKITTDVANIIARHPLAKHLHGKENTWRADTLVVNGATDGRNASVTSWGVMSNITGSRADFIIYDDTEVPKNSRTEVEREKLREKLDEPTHILVPGGYELFVGTPHSHESIYTELAGESANDEPFRSGCSKIRIPIMEEVVGDFPNMEGTPVWPERFPLAEIQKRQRGSSTKGHFLSQYLLLPYNPEDTVLDPTLISTYNHEIVVHEANGGIVARIGPNRIMGVSCVWDPSMANKKSDDSVLAIVFTTEDGHYYIHRAVKLNGDPREQCDHVRRIMKEAHCTHVIIENNGPGAMLPYIFRNTAGGTGMTCEGVFTGQNKGEKIMSAHEVRLAAGLIHASKQVMESPYRTQLRDFSLSTSGRSKDDFIDAVSMAILKQPNRIKAASYGVRQSQWQGAVSGGSFEVPMDGVTF